MQLWYTFKKYRFSHLTERLDKERQNAGIK